MTNEESFDSPAWDREPAFTAEKKLQADQIYLLDLVRVLRLHPAGLRRWSVMRAIRKNREMSRMPIPQKIEDAVERVFRNHCADTENFKKRESTPEAALFHMPQGRAGGVWSVYPERAEAWLKALGAMPD